MAQIEIILEKQLLTIQNREVISSGDMNYDSCKFTFDEAWADYIYTAVFYQNKQQVYYAVLDKENKCFIPAKALAKASPLYIGVFGVKGNKVITSTMDTITIVEGAISGTELDMEPPDTVFASIIAYYQAILGTIAEQNTILEKANTKYTEAYELLENQDAWLSKLGAFEIEPLETRMSEMEITLAGYGEVIDEAQDSVNQTLEQIRAQSFVLRNITVELDENNEFRLGDERVDENCLCTAYFDAIYVEQTIGHAIFVESHDGYIKIISTTKFSEPLVCTIEVRRGEE